MIVDASAMVAIIRGEPEAKAMVAALTAEKQNSISAGNFLETAIVVDGQRDPALSGALDGLLAKLNIQIEPVTEAQSRIARQAYRDFGKGSGHPAKLNFGDCFAYALTIERGEPLLYKGDDFAHAGLERVV